MIVPFDPTIHKNGVHLLELHDTVSDGVVASYYVDASVSYEEASKMPWQYAVDDSTIEKGGPGSGNYDHAGRPGKVGGSASGRVSAKPKFNRSEWEGRDMKARREEWGNLSVGERDRQVDAAHTVIARQKQVTEFAGDWPKFDGDVKHSIEARSNALKDLAPGEALGMIADTVSKLDDLLAETGADPELRHAIAMDAIDCLAVQENEALGRQLGDHGIHHILGNIGIANDILAQHPGEDTPEDRASIYIAAIYHDAGYLTEPSHIFIDEGHPRWSQQHFDKNVAPLISEALGDVATGNISHMIRTHDSTDIDWEGDTVPTALRIADNLALFHKEKLPPVFRYVPGNTELLEQLASKEIDIDTAKRGMIVNIAKTDFSPWVKSELNRAVREVSAVTPKFTLGMLGGFIQSIKWSGDHITVNLRRSSQFTRLQKLLDLGQRQFAKLAEAYGIDPNVFKDSLRFALTNSNGRIVLDTNVAGEEIKATLKMIAKEDLPELKGQVTPMAEIVIDNEEDDDWMKSLPGYKDEINLHTRLAKLLEEDNDAKADSNKVDTP